MPASPSDKSRKLGQSQLLWGALVVAACVAGGSLECQRPALSPVEEHGRQLYTKMCSVCHGVEGEGYKADQAPAIGHPDFLATASDAYLKTAIIAGRSGTTMSAWSIVHGGPLSATDVDALVGYLRQWGPSARAALDESPLRGDATRGQAIYARECTRCHGDRGIGGPNVHIGGLDFLRSATNGYIRYIVHKGRSRTAMPSFEKTLGGQDIEDAVAYLRGLAKTNPPPAARPVARPPPIPLGPVPLNPRGPEPVGFLTYPQNTPAAVIKAQLDRHAKMAILDARAPSDYAMSHIAGAVSVPFYDPNPYFDKLPKDSWLVCYCSCPHAESGMLAAALQKQGFKKVTVIAEGLPTWTSRNYGTSTGNEP